MEAIMPLPTGPAMLLTPPMSPKHITSHSLRHLLTLTEKKEQLLKGIEEVEHEIAKALKGTATSAVRLAETVTPFKTAKKSKGKKTRQASKPGGLKERILALLHETGDQGLHVREIAEKLGSKAANISVWFSTTGKKLARKVEPGRYAVKTSTPVPAVPSVKASKTAKPAAKKGSKLPKAGKNPF